MTAIVKVNARVRVRVQVGQHIEAAHTIALGAEGTREGQMDVRGALPVFGDKSWVEPLDVDFIERRDAHVLRAVAEGRDGVVRDALQAGG